MKKSASARSGSGRAFTLMLPALSRDPRVQLVAAADPRNEARSKFEADFQARSFGSVRLCKDPPSTSLHRHPAPVPRRAGRPAACTQAPAGREPMALTLEDCRP